MLLLLLMMMMIRTKEPCALLSHYILIYICVWRCVYDCEKRVTWYRAEMSSSVKGVYVCTFVGREHTFLSNERYTRFCLLNIFLPYVLPHGNLNLTHKKKRIFNLNRSITHFHCWDEEESSPRDWIVLIAQRSLHFLHFAYISGFITPPIHL